MYESQVFANKYFIIREERANSGVTCLEFPILWYALNLTIGNLLGTLPSTLAGSISN
jgi:hypothetical protein